MLTMQLATFILCCLLLNRLTWATTATNQSNVGIEAHNTLNNTVRDIDYSLVEDDDGSGDGSGDGDGGGDDDEMTTAHTNLAGQSSVVVQKKKSFLSHTETKVTRKPMIMMQTSQPTNNVPGRITNMSDIVKLVRFVFLRGHIVLDASHRVMVKNESRIERLMDYLHDIQLRRGKHRILPMEDRDLACEDIPDSKLHLKELCQAATFDCLSASEMMDMLSPSITFHQAIARICPLLLFRQSRPICIADVKKRLDEEINKKITIQEPSIERVWGFGVLFVTISIVVSMGGLMLLPFLKKSSRTTILTFFEGLAAGGLAGSAVLHLFPQAFDIVDEKYRAYFWNTLSIFCGIYLFYCIEMSLKIFKTYYGKNRKRRMPSLIVLRDDIFVEPQAHNTPTPASSINFLSDCTGGSVYQIKYATSSEDSESSSSSRRNSVQVDAQQQIVSDKSNMILSSSKHQSMESQSDTEVDRESLFQRLQDKTFPVFKQTSTQSGASSYTGPAREALISSTREQLAQCLSTVNVMPPPPSSSVIMQRQVSTSPLRRPFKERMVPNVALRRQDHETANTITIDTVAWMIVLGDALLNFIDGLSIGAAFDRNILAGMSISVAVMLEEVTHRLGTFAVLIRTGMSMKQSFFYIFLSACSCYPGLALGIFLGDEAEDASPYIFALAAGFFLYMALVDVMNAMTRTMENASRKNIRTLLHIWALQNIGIVLATISLALLAFYEKEMDFEVREIAEIKKNSLQFSNFD